MIERWNAPDRAAIRTTLNRITEGQLDPATLERTSKGEWLEGERLTQRLHVVAQLNFYEELAIGVFDESVDEEKAYRFFKSVIEQTYVGVMPLIERERAIDKRASYFVEFQALAERWRARQC